VVQQIGTWALSALLVLALALWSTRAVNPLWPAAVFALARAGISYGTGATPLTAAGTALVQGDPATWVWPLLSAALVSGLCLAGAVWTFSRKEI